MQPVFLVAPVRSGSTMLHLMLDSHPEIANPGECDFLFDQVTEDGLMPDVQSYQKYLEINRYFLAMNLKNEEVASFPDLIDSYVKQMQGGNKVIVMNVHHDFQKIPRVFPEAKYIHLLRDGRDVARSCIGMGWAGSTYYGIDIWREAEESWNKLKPMLDPSQYMEIQYEEFLENVEGGLENICQFAGVEYSPKMLDYANTSTYSLPDKSLSYQWKKKYSKRELALVEMKAKDLLLSRGYELSGVNPSKPGLVERIYLYMQNKWYRASWQINVYGLTLFVKFFVAQKTGMEGWLRLLTPEMNEAITRTLK